MGTGGVPFLEVPKEKVRPARFRKPLALGGGGSGISENGFRWTLVSSGCWWWLNSAGGAADDGAVETALWREDVSVEAVLVVLEDPLPLGRIGLAL